jgi:hypothetical protein
MCAYGWMDGWACSSNLSQHLLTQFNHTIFLEKKWMGWAGFFFFGWFGGKGANFLNSWGEFFLRNFFLNLNSKKILNLEKKNLRNFFS